MMQVLRRAWRKAQLLSDLMATRHLGLIAAGVAFFGVLAIFPALAAVIAVWGMFADPQAVAASLEDLSEFLPPDAFDILNAQVQGLVLAPPGQLGWTTALTLGAALWSARAGMAALIGGINAAFGTENRGGIRHQIVSLGLTVAMVGAALAALTAGVLVPLLLALVPLGPFEASLVQFVRWAVAPLATILGIGLIYRYGPNLTGTRPPLLSVGLGVAVVLWLAASEGFSIYLVNFGSYNKIYGSIGALAALLMWVYLSAYAVLIGAVVNAWRWKATQRQRKALQ